MANAWVEHIRKFARENNKSYGCALSDPACKLSYTPLAKKPTQKSERASMGGNDVNRARTVRGELQNMAKRRDASDYLKYAGSDAKKSQIITFKPKKSNKSPKIITFKPKKSNKSAEKV